MDLRQLEVLQAIVESGSFTKAGQRLHLSQSAISRHIILLEDELKEPLFLRIGRRIRITPAGESILALAQRVSGDMKETRAILVEKQTTLSGTIRLAGHMTACLYVFPELIKEYRRRHPSMEVRVSTGLTPRLLRRLRTGADDVGLLPLPIDEPDLVTVPVLEEELVLVTSRDHPLSRHVLVRPADLLGQPFVLFEPAATTRRLIDSFFARERIQPRIVSESENVEILKALVRIGLGMTIIPYQAVAREVQNGDLSAIRIDGSPLVRQTGWVHMRLNRLPRAVQEMMMALDLIVDRLRLSFDTPRPVIIDRRPNRISGRAITRRA